MYELLIVPLLALHLLCVNVASAGPLVSVWLEWKEGRGDSLAGRATRYLGHSSLWLLLAGGVLGVLVGWLSWSGDYAELWTKAMRYKAEWGVGEYAFSVLLAAGYVAWRRFGAARGRWLRYGLLLLNGSNLLYHFPFLFSVATSVLAADAETDPLSRSEFRVWMMRPDVLARVVHVLLASVAVTGILLLGFSERLQRTGTPGEEAHRVARWGGWIALVPSLAQVPAGLWLITVLPATWQHRVLGGDLLASSLLGISVLLSVFMLQDLAGIALGDVQRRQVMRVMVMMLLVVLLMTAVLRRIRPPEPANSQVQVRTSTQVAFQFF